MRGYWITVMCTRCELTYKQIRTSKPRTKKYPCPHCKRKMPWLIKEMDVNPKDNYLWWSVRQVLMDERE